MADENAARAATEIEDDRLRLIFTCCHPAIDPKLQVPLTLREVCGLTTEEIAHAFLTSKATMAQQIVRGKAKIRDEQIPYARSVSGRPARAAGRGTFRHLFGVQRRICGLAERSLFRVDLTAEAIRLGRLLLELLPDPEAKGLLALMLLHESRGRHAFPRTVKSFCLKTRTAPVGTIKRFPRGGTGGASPSIASIWCVHAPGCHFGNSCPGRHRRPDGLESNCRALSALLGIDSSPIVELNRAVAVAFRDGPEAGLVLIDAIHKTRRLAGLSPCPRGPSRAVPAARKNVRTKNSYERALSFGPAGNPRAAIFDRRLSEMQF